MDWQAIQSQPDLWKIYTAQEEYGEIMRDQYGRFNSASTSRTFDHPVVSQALYDQGFRPSYPNNAPFAVCLTHDIDVLFIPKKILADRSLRHLIKGRRSALNECIRALMNRKQNPFYCIEDILALEKKYGAQATYFFLALEKGEQDFNYSLAEVADVIRSVSEEGHEIGLHGGHEAYCNLDKILEEKGRLSAIARKEIVGYRNHYLRFDVPNTWYLLQQAGFEYDSTYGVIDAPGFRNGMCYPFIPYDHNQQHWIPTTEIPLTIMDDTLYSKYMGLSRKEALERCFQLVDRVQSVNGVVTFLWHNNHGLGLDFYEDFLAYCQQKGAWMTSCTNLLQWWKAQVNQPANESV